MPDIFKPSKETAAPKATKSQKMIPSPQGHVLSSFCVLPKNTSFQAQLPNEQIILLLRPHPVTNLGWILSTIIAVLLPVLIISFIPDVPTYISVIPPQFYFTIGALYFLGIGFYIVSHVIAWFYNLFLVTNQRVVDIDYDNVMYQDIAITKLQEIEDVHFTQSGFFSSLFDYGDIDIQTEANKPNFEAEKVPNPSYAANLMASYIEKERNN